MNDSNVQSVDRAIDLLEIMVDLGGDATLSQLAASTQLPQPTIHRLIRTLVNRGYARQLPSRRYALGPRLIHMGESAGRQLGAGTRTHLERLARELGESANLAILDSGMAVYIAQASATRSVRMFTEVGRRVFCHCTGVGKAILSELPNETVRKLLARVGMKAATEHSLTSVQELLEELDRIRVDGYAVDDGEQEIGVKCFAVAVPDAPVPTALSVSGPTARMTHSFGASAVSLLQDVAEDISAGMHLVE